MRRFSLFFSILIAINSCHRSVFIFESQDSKSCEKFELLDEEVFIYKHKDKKAKLRVLGDYKIKGNIISFRFNPMSHNLRLFPNSYTTVEMDKKGEYNGIFIENILVISSQNEEPLGFADVAGYLNDELITGAQTDFDGNASIRSDVQLDELRVMYLGMRSVHILLKEKGSFNIVVKLEEINVFPIEINDGGYCFGTKEGPIVEMKIKKTGDRIVELIGMDKELKIYHRK